MATVKFDSQKDFYTLANYLSFGSQFQEALRTCGLVQTGDSGQINFVAYAPTITGTELTNNVAKYYVSSTAGLRVNLTMTVAGVVNNAAVYNISGAITSVGANYFTLAKTNANIAYTADTGTATASIETSYPAYNTSRYQVWRFDDALQATCPIFFRIWYGNYLNSSGNNCCGLFFTLTVGTGTNGAGSITNGYTLGSTTLSYELWSVAAGYTSTYSNCPTLISVAPGRLTMLLWRNASYPLFFNLERTKDASGNDTANGLYTMWNWCTVTAATPVLTNYIGFDFMNPAGTHYTDTSALPSLAFSGSSTLMSAGIAVFPYLSPWGGMQNPLMNVMSGKAADYAEADTLSYAIYPNKTVTYIVSKYTNSGQIQQKMGGYGTNNCIIMRWD